MKRYLFILIMPLLLAWGCSEVKQGNDPSSPESLAKVSSCEGCHTNYNHLKAVYTKDPPHGAGGGCGGETPVIEPYDRVFMGGEGYAEFKNSIHGKIDCTICHNGTNNTSDKTKAHSNNFISKPSHYPEEKCGSCHPNIVNNAKDNIHSQGWGQKNMVSTRSGLGEIPSGFERLTAAMKAGYDENCGKCHAACGDCHVNRPKAGGAGLYKGHSFVKPDMVDHCTTCHVSRGGHAYFGVAPGTVPDVHLTKAGYTCMNCHSKHELHGDGKLYNQRYKVADMPECIDCHSGVASSNKFHTAHMNSFSCNTCHSQDYNNCGSCHIGGDGARVPSYQGYKIGLNPIPTIRSKYKYALLRQSLSAPDSWMNFGTPILTNLSSQPTYKYTSPHNIIKITPRTGFKNSQGQWVVNTDCASGCHIKKNTDGTFKNKELYLFNENLENWEKSADVNIVVDGKLPSKWGL